MNLNPGNKAQSLLKLKEAGFIVPDFFVCDHTWQESKIQRAIKQHLPCAKSFAVRSSSRHEDSAQSSRAGYYYSAVNVPTSQVFKQYKSVLNSYEDRTGAVIIQEFIPSTSAGVTFSNAGDGTIVINAGHGLCKNIVEGDICDEYVATRDGMILKQECPLKSIPPFQLQQVIKLAVESEKFFGAPQDIEWCFLANRLFLLQARPITKNLVKHEEEYFDSANIAESYSGIILPLTSSFAQHIYQQVYTDFLRMSGVPKRQLEQHAYVFNSLLGFFHGRMYYNMNNWYRLAQFAPGYKRNKKNFETMINSRLEKSIQCTIKPHPTLKLLYPFIFLGKFIAFDFTSWRFKRYVQKNISLIKQRNFNSLSLDDCRRLASFLQNKLLRKWYVALENDFFVMTYLGLLQKIAPDHELQNILAFKSKATEQVAALAELSQTMQKIHPLWQTVLKNDSQEFKKIIKQSPVTKTQLDRYLETFGGRFANELKLETVGIDQDPSKLLEVMRIYAHYHPSQPTPNNVAFPKMSWSKRIVFLNTLRRFKKYALRREEFRLLRSNMFSINRNIFIRIGTIMAEQKLLDRAEDIFYLTIEEALTANKQNLTRLIKERQTEYRSYKDKNPPAHFVTNDDTIPPNQPEQSDSANSVRARGISPGIVRGRVKIIKTFSLPKRLDFDILVTRHTDPGWTALIALSKGLIIEHGGILSHASIVARELGIPAVIGVTNATNHYKDGQILTINGSNGTITEERNRMETQNYNSTKATTNELYNLLSSTYSQDKNFNFFLLEYKNALQYCLNSRHISYHPLAIKENHRLLGHVALIRDDRLKKREAFFGFLEFIDDNAVFTRLWQQLTSLAKQHNISTLKGPVNGSIWHQYRCVKKDNGEEFSRTEPITPPHYYRFLSRMSPRKEISFSSGSRQSFVSLIGTLKQRQNIFQDLQAKGFNIERQAKVLPWQFLSILDISKTSFSKSWGYTDLDYDELENLYSIQKINANLNNIYLLYQDRNIIGYCSVMKENQTLECKTICIRPEFQNLGLGNALALAIHHDAIKIKITEIKYLLVRDGNQVHNYPTDDLKIFRRYAAFDYKLG